MHPVHPLKPFAIPSDWSPEQAMAVVDLLDELREHIWARYELQLLEAYREHYQPPRVAPPLAARDDEQPF